jgi:AraC-like DNA-binding protein
MDILSDLMNALHLKSVVYFKHHFCSPWGMDSSKSAFAQFHVVVRGRCVLKMDGKAEPITLYGGDMVLFPHGTPHQIMDDLQTECRSGKQVVETIMRGDAFFEGEETNSTLICGHYELDQSLDHPFYQSLPKLIHLKSADPISANGLDTIINMIIQETQSSKLGASTISTKLAEVLFIKVIRHYLESISRNNSFLNALKDRKIQEVLNLIHEYPQENWSLISLSRKVGISRTLLANKFRELVGQTPMKYLFNWRMQMAKKLLQNTDQTSFEVSSQIGYQSETAFNRAFKAHFDLTPHKFKRSLKLEV